MKSREAEIMRSLDLRSIHYRKIQNSDELLLTCPNPDCGKENHLYFNTRRLVGFCQRCRQPYTLARLVHALHLPLPESQQPAPTVEELKAATKLIWGSARTNNVVVNDIVECEMPFGWQPAWKHRIAIKYLSKRGIPAELLIRHNLAYCPYGPFAKRVIFPVIWDRKLIGFIGRSVVSDSPKYLFPKGFPASQILYPQEHTKLGRVTIVEGVIPALIYHGVATFGKHLSLGQLKILIKNCNGVRNVILLWDRDAWEDSNGHGPSPALKAWTELSKYFACLGVVLPRQAPQPDHLPYSNFLRTLELSAAKAADSSRIIEVTDDLQALRIA